MKLIAIAATLALAVLMFFVRREYKLAMLFLSTILLTPLILPFKGITPAIVLTLAFLLSEIPYLRIHWKRIRLSVILPYLLLALVAFALAVVTSPHLHNANSLGFFTLSELLSKQLAVVYGFLALRRNRSLQPLLTVSFVALLLMTVVGVANYFMGYSFYVEELLDESYSFITTSRFRVQATFNNPFDYGYICVLLALLFFYGFSQRQVTRTRFIIAQVCCLFGVIACNCRTVVFCYLVCLLVYFIAQRKEVKVKLTVLGASVALGLLLVLVVPRARRVLLSVFSIFDTNAVTDGSSLGMRLTQLGTVIYYIRDKVLFGNGVHFFEEDLGWDNGASGKEVDTDLFGLEGIGLNLLLERGVIGLLLFLAMMILLLVFICKYRKLGRKLYALGLSVFLLYILFSFMTGELNSARPAFYILGYVISNLTLRKRYLEWKKKHAES